NYLVSSTTDTNTIRMDLQSQDSGLVRNTVTDGLGKEALMSV
ncbi:camk camkl gin4 protein kinase, partial [Moniliophthora roreri]